MKGRKLLLETFEDRILCSVTAPVNPEAPQGDAAPVSRLSADKDVSIAAAPAPGLHHAEADAPAEAAATEDAAATSRELIVINGNLPDAQQLIAELTKNSAGRSFEVVTLDTYRDGIEQITELLAARGGKFDAIHLLGHGDSGYINLGASRLDISDLEGYANDIARWGLSLNSGADILFYGCNFASGAGGQQIVQRVAQLTGADVAASTDPTGAASMGGDWNLEYSVGSVKPALGAQAGQSVTWSHLLAGTPIDGGVGSFMGVTGNRFYSISFDTGKATLIGTSNYVGANGTLNSLGVDSVNGIAYYSDSANGSRAIYGFDLRTAQQFVVVADVTTMGVTLPAAGLGAAGGDFANGYYYFTTEGGGPNSGGNNGTPTDQIYRLTFTTGSNGRSAQTITLIDYIPGANEFGDFIVIAGSPTKFYSFNSATGVDEYNLTASPATLAYVQRDANTNVTQAALDRNGNMYTVGNAIRSYNPAGSGTFGAPRAITTDGTTALNDLADGASYTPAEASIGDRVWYDADLDGVQDAGETGVVGLTVSLYDDLNGNGALDSGERLLATTTTGTNGAYTFGQLLPGDYLIQVSDPSGIMQGAASTTGGNLQAASVTLVGQAITNKDFGYESLPTIQVSSPAVTEGATTHAVFTVSLSRASTSNVVMNLALANGTATGGGTDFGPGLEVSTNGGSTWTSATSATIPAGSTSVLVRTPLINDTLDEAAETFTLTATRTAGTTSNNSAVGTATITDDDPTPSLSINDVTVNEAAGTATFTVTLSAASGQAVSVNYATSNGTATAGSDYTAASGTLNFAAGTVTRTFTVPITNDTLFENSETFNVTLSAPVNATIADGTGVGTIRDDGTGTGGTDNDTPTISVSSPAVTEGTNTHAVFTISLTNASTTAVTMNLALANGTATGGGTDFGPGLEVSTNGGNTWISATSATIAAGSTSVLVRTPINNDTLDEATENFTLTATRTAGTTTNSSATGTATITDNDAPPTLSVNDITVNEATGMATFTVTLNTASGQTVNVNYATSNGTATAGSDYTASSGTLTFAPGVVSQTFTVPITNDTVFENSETFNVTLSTPVNATIADGSGVATIRDDGTGSGGTDNDTPTISVSSPAVTEGTDAYAVFTVSLSNASTTAVTTSLALANGTATGGGTDFGPGLEVSTNGGSTWTSATSATIAAGSTSVLVRTPINNDTLDETTENFTLTATRTAGTTTNSSATGTATITDNDPPPTLSVNDITINEGAGTATFTVTLNTASGQAVSVNYATSNGTATAGSDYTAASGTLNFTPGVLTQTFTVPITNDTVFENSETFNVTLSSPVNATIADGTGVGTIRDNGTGTGGTDNDTPTISVSNPAVTEGADAYAVFTVSLSNISTTAVATSLALANGTATGGGTDFGPGLEVSTNGGTTWVSASSVTIAAGSTSVLVRTPIANDALDEAAETFTLTATRTAGTTTNTSASGTGTIVDDDPPPFISINDVTVNEGAGTMTFTVTLDTPSGQTVSVNYSTSDGTATAGTDYTAAAGAVNFAPGVISQTITVPILNDAIFEGSENFNVVLSAPVNGIIADNTGVGTILDDGTGPGGTNDDRPTISVSNVSATEGTDPYAVFSVNLSNQSTTSVGLSFALANGTAQGAGTDFGPGLEVSTDGGATWTAGSTAVIAAGSTSVLVRTPITDDTLDEASETFTLTATRTSGTTTNSSAAGTATIVDNDDAPALTINNVTVNEAAGTATFTVTLDAVSAQNVSVNYATANGSALASADYTAASGTLNFAPGVLSQTITVPITNDTIFEGSETFSIVLASAVNASIADGTGIGTINDDGTGAGGTDNDTPALSITDTTVTEGTDPYAVFTVSLSNASTTPVNLSLALANGSATGGGTDFGPGLEVSTDGGVNWTAAAAATIAPGSTSVLVRTPIVNDGTNETTEDFTLTATRTGGATTNTAVTGTASIVDDDAPGSLSINDVTVNEGAGTATFTVTLSSPSASTVTVNYTTVDGTAVTGADFTGTSGLLTFAPGVLTQTVTVPILNDTIFEGSEAFTVRLSNASNASIGDANGTGTILDNGTGPGGTDNDAPTIGVGNVAVTEGTDAYAVFNVTLSNLSTTPVTASLALANGTATGGGTDFGPGLEVSTNGGGTWVAASSVTIPAGSTSVLVRTPITNDALSEASENFTLTATVTSGTTANNSAFGTATIADNDSLPSFTINDVTVNEGAGTATFTVTLNTASGQTVSVDYATSSGSATTGADFTNTTGTLSFTAGVTSRTFTVPIVNDSIYEGSESFNITLNNAVNATIADGTGVGTILDDGTGPGGTDDDRPVNTLPPTFTTPEDAGLILSGISISNSDPNRTVTVTLSVGSGVLNFSTSVVGGITAGQVSGNGTGTVTVTAPLNAINATFADAAGVQFVPPPDFHGNIPLSLNIVDGLGTDTDAATITVTPVVDIADDSGITDEDTPITIAVLANDSFEDATRTITAVNGQAITAGGPAVAVPTGSVTLDGLGQLTFTPSANYQGPATFTYTVTSGGATETANVNISVNSVNDPLAVSGPNTAASTEDTPYVFSSGNGNALVIEDLDGGLLSVTLSVANGTLTLGSTSNLTMISGDGTADATLTFQGLAGDINAALEGLTFIPIADYNGPAVLNLSVTDVASAAPNLINGGFEQPAGVSGSQQLNENAVDGWETSASDGLIEIWESGFMGVTAFQGGQFAEINATQAATLSQTITPLTAGTLKFSFAHRGRAGVDTINVRITDLGTDGALGGGDDTVLLSENFSDGTGAWGYYDRTLVTATGNPALVEFTSVSTASGSPSIGNFVDGIFFGVPNDAATKSVTIAVAPVPDVVDDSATTAEDTPVAISVLANDNFENPGRTITAVNGTAIVAGGAAVAVTNGTVALNMSEQLVFTPAQDYNGPASFTYTVTSNGTTETANVNITVTPVTDPPVIDLDSTTGGSGTSATFIENGNATPIIGPNVAITDIDDTTLSSALVVLTNAQAGDSLTIFGSLPPGISGSVDTSVAGQITVNLSGVVSLATYQTALQQIQFSNSSDDPSTIVRTISVTVNDGALVSNTATSLISVVAVNDAPGVTVPGTQSATPGAALPITGISFGDVDASGNTVTVTLSVTGGALTVSNSIAGGLVTGQITGNGTSAVTLSGTLAEINATLADAAGLTFVNNTSGTYTLTAAINDLGNSGVDPSTLSQPNTGTATDERASRSFDITVTPPSISIADVAVTEGTDPYAVFNVTLSNPSGSDITVNFALADGTATGGGVDFGTLLEVSTDGGTTWNPASSATIAAGSTSVLVRTPIVDDSLDESAETFTLAATVVSGSTNNSSASSTATITDDDAAPSLSINDVTVNEGAGTMTFTVTLSSPSGMPLSVNYATASGTATSAADFTGVSGTLNFGVGVTSQTITVAITNDTIFENSESFDVLLSGAVNATIADGTGVGTILDDGTGPGGTDNDTPALSVSNVTVTEGVDGYATFAVSLSNLSTTPVAVSLALANGTALGGGTDFGPGLEVSTDGGTSWTSASAATIAPGSASVLVRTPITNDSLSEAPETFTLTATRTSGTTTNLSATGTATIADDDSLPSITINDVTVNEGAGTATFTVTLSAISAQNVSVNYATGNGTALAGADYLASSGVLHFAPGVTSQTITVAILNDSTFEGSENFTVSLSGVVNATIADGTGLGTILDDGTGGGGTDNDTPTLSVSNVSATEGTDSYVVFGLNLSNPSTTSVSVNLALMNGTALGGGTDFGPGLEISTDGGTSWVVATSATFIPGSTSLLARTPLTDDPLDEDSENFTLNATVTAGTTRNASAAGVGTIADDDGPPPISINDVTVNEKAGTATFTVTLAAVSGQTVTVDYFTQNISAIAGSDYTGVAGTLTFAPGVTSQTIVVPILDDTIFENSESFFVLLSGAANASFADDTGVGTILDNGTGSGGTDNDTPTLSVGNIAVTEGTDPYAVFTVSLSNLSTTPVDVNLALSNGSAIGGGTDFGPGLEVSTDGGSTWVPASTATIAAGASSVLVRTPVTDDLIDENAEDFSLTAIVTSGATTNAQATGTATIADDDATPSLAINDVTVNEAAGTMTFTVTLSAASGLPVSVNYATSNGTATAGADYTAASQTLNFAPGETTKTVVITIANDTIFESSESFNVLLSGPVNATIADGSGVGTILDDGTGGGGTDNDTPTLSINDIAVTEGTDFYAVFTLSLSNLSTTPVTLDLALNDGSATGGGVDFGAGLEVSTDGGGSWVAASSVTIAAGSSSVLVRTAVVDDSSDESLENFTLTATVTSGATTNLAVTGTATITDDDVPPTISIDNLIVNEADGTATFTVSLSTASGLAVSVNYATADGSARTGSDFVSQSGVLNFAPGVTSQTIVISILDDTLFENTESFNVVLSGATNATIADGTGEATILDDDVRRASVSLVATSDPGTLGNQTTIGEVVTYELQLELAEGANLQTTLHDVLPAGMQFLLNSPIEVGYLNVNSTITGFAAGTYTNATADAFISSSLTANNDVFGDGTGVFFKLGTLVNNDNDADREFVTIRFSAVVTNTPQNQAGVLHDNTFSALLDTDNNGTPGYVSLDTDGDNVATGSEVANDPLNDGTGSPGFANLVTTEVVEPILVLDKQITTAPSVIKAGDTITYTVTITHAVGSNATAWEATLADVVPAGLQLVSIDSVTLAGGAQEQAAAAIGGGGSSLGGVWDVPVSGSVTVVYTATVTSDAVLGTTLNNLADLSWSSLDGASADARGSGDGLLGAGGLNDYQLQDSAGAVIENGASDFSLTKQVLGDNRAEIGERLTYQLTLTVADGIVNSISLNDLIPTGFTLVNGSAQLTAGTGVTVSGASFNYGSNQLTLDIAQLQSAVDGIGNTITITYQVDVLNTASNVNGSVKTNFVDATYPALGATVSTSANVTIAEPVLAISKTVDDATPHLGQTVTYTLVITHDSASRATAFDLVLNDALPPGVSLNASSIQLVSAPPGTSIVSNTSVDGGAFQLALNQLALGESVAITFTATVSSDPAIIGGTFGGGDDTLSSTLALSYDTQPGANAEQRSHVDNVSTSLTVVGADLAVTKSDGQTTANAGDRLTYTITVTNNGTDAATNVIVTDTLPASGITFNNLFSTPGASVSGNTVVYQIPSLAAGATATFTVVIDLANPTAPGTEFVVNMVDVQHDDVEPTIADNSATDTDTLESAPDYSITVTDNRTSAKPGQVLEYVITVRNIGNQDGLGIVVSDTFSTGIFSSIIADNGGVVDLNAGTVVWNIATLAAGDSITLTLRGTVNATFTSIPVPVGTPVGAIPDNDAIGHTLTVTDDGSGGPDTTPANNTATDLDDLQPVPELKIKQTDGVTIAKPGKLVTYHIVATNAGLQDSNGMVITDTLPEGVKLVSTSSNDPALTGTPVVFGRTITWTFLSAVPAGMEITFNVVVRVDEKVTPGAKLVNRVEITDDGFYGPDAVTMKDNVAIDTNDVPPAPPEPTPEPTPVPSRPAPAPAPFVFAFDSFNNFASDSMQQLGQLARTAPIDQSPVSILPLVPIYSGEAAPGTTLVISLYNARGERIGSQTVIADSGGNWLATFPSTEMRDIPNSVQITALAAPYSSGESAGCNLRTYFSPAIDPGNFTLRAFGSNSIGDESAPLLGGLGLENPLELGNVKYGGELLSTQATAGGY